MPLISLVINCDTRPERNNQDGLMKGVIDLEFLDEGVFNKIKFFDGFDIETIVFIDKHKEIPEKKLEFLYKNCDTVCIRKHTDEHAFNDWNYVNALSLARGQYICHCDQDTACFTTSSEPIQEMIDLLSNNVYKFISYPSHWSPLPVHDESFGGKVWASTRFFMCKKESLQLDILKRCITNPEWMYAGYGDSPRRCNWVEHFLTKINENSCFYPPIELNRYAIFTWGAYDKYILQRLNNQTYYEVREFIFRMGGIVYPNDVYVR